ncbi:MAG: phosphotriesterase [Alphaproteobacteria bacterium]|nr:MAG: phosphotriesterase [Alphaproteobacteria bacterium]
MSTVETMKGPIDSSQLGRVLVHEHVFLMNMEYVENYRLDFDEDVEVANAVQQLNQLKAAGIDTIIDLTVLGLGRHVKRLAKVASQIDLNIIVATGVYTFNEVPGPFEYVGPGLMIDVPEPMVELFVNDITKGIAGTSIKAGELKCAIDAPGLTKGVERVMRAIAQAQLLTGVPISVHTAATKEMGLVAQKLFAEEGVDLRDLIIGHSGDSDDLDYLMKLADQGSILGMDRFGIDAVLPFEKRVGTIVELVKRGYTDRITLSHDCMCWIDMFPKGFNPMPRHRYLHISEEVIPALLEQGVTQAQIDIMFIDNPRRHYEDAAARFAAR